MALRPCLHCGRPGPTSRCPTPACQPPPRPAPHIRRPGYTKAERERRAATVAEWRNTYGNWCPGWAVPPHPSTDLTADHITPVDAGGDEAGPLAVLCRGCNGRKGAKVSLP